MKLEILFVSVSIIFNHFILYILDTLQKMLVVAIVINSSKLKNTSLTYKMLVYQNTQPQLTQSFKINIYEIHFMYMYFPQWKQLRKLAALCLLNMVYKQTVDAAILTNEGLRATLC